MSGPTSSHKILIICGPTATGKTALAAKLARQLNGELISADSRQVYQGMDVGTGKDRPKGITIHGYDLVRPDQDFSVADWVKFAWGKIKPLWHQGKLPIIVGGTGLYLKSLIVPPASLGVKPDKQLRNKLNNLTVRQLQARLRRLDPDRFNRMNSSDQHNPRRLIRAIEVAGKKGESFPQRILLKGVSQLWLGLTAPLSILDQRIKDRVIARARRGMTTEVRQLMRQYPNWSYPAFSATGYRQWRAYLEGKITRAEAIDRWYTAERQYSRRQLTWFKRQPQIHWSNMI